MGELSDESFKLSEQAKATELRLKNVEVKFQERVQQLDLQVNAQKDAIAIALRPRWHQRWRLSEH